MYYLLSVIVWFNCSGKRQHSNIYNKRYYFSYFASDFRCSLIDFYLFEKGSTPILILMSIPKPEVAHLLRLAL